MYYLPNCAADTTDTQGFNSTLWIPYCDVQIPQIPMNVPYGFNSKAGVLQIPVCTQSSVMRCRYHRYIPQVLIPWYHTIPYLFITCTHSSLCTADTTRYTCSDTILHFVQIFLSYTNCTIGHCMSVDITDIRFQFQSAVAHHNERICCIYNTPPQQLIRYNFSFQQFIFQYCTTHTMVSSSLCPANDLQQGSSFSIVCIYQQPVGEVLPVLQRI